jgi:hypothetical protein
MRDAGPECEMRERAIGDAGTATQAVPAFRIALSRIPYSNPASRIGSSLTTPGSTRGFGCLISLAS